MNRIDALVVVAAAAVTTGVALEFTNEQAATAAGIGLFILAAVCLGAWIVLLTREKE